MIGVHGWGVPGVIGGFKAAAEYQHFVVDNDTLKASSQPLAS